jgi:hypothetical protein
VRVAVEQVGVRHRSAELRRGLPVRPQAGGGIACSDSELEDRGRVTSHLGMLREPGERTR